jgi:hypothetical protein
VTFGRADGSHAIVIDSSLTFRDSVVIQAPVGTGSITFGDATGTAILKTTSRGDSLTLIAGDDITIDGSLQTIGSGSLSLHANADASESGDLLVGQNLAGKVRPLVLGTESGALSVQGENVVLGKADPTNPKLGAVAVRADRGNIQIISDFNGDGGGNFLMSNSKSTMTTNGIISIGTADSQAGFISTNAVTISARQGLEIHSFGGVSLGAGTTVKNVGNVLINSARNITLGVGSQIISTGSIDLLADRDNSTRDANDGHVQLDTGVKLIAKGALHIEGYLVTQAAKVLLKSSDTVITQG